MWFDLPSLTFLHSKPGRSARPPFMNTVYGTHLCGWDTIYPRSEQRRIVSLLTAVVTVINRGMLLSTVKRVSSSRMISVMVMLCVIIYPLQTCYCPFDHLTVRRFISKQKKWSFRGKEDRPTFISVCFAAKTNFCVVMFNLLYTRRKSPSLSVRVFGVVVIPVNRTSIQVSGRTFTAFINTVSTWGEYQVC